MTREEALKIWLPVISMGVDTMVECKEALNMAIKALEQEPCEDAVSQKIDEFELKGKTAEIWIVKGKLQIRYLGVIHNIPLPPVTPKQRLCKDCKFFEYDSVVKVDGIPLIVAHEICNRWGDGCKTYEDGYCFMFEPKEGESE